VELQDTHSRTNFEHLLYNPLRSATHESWLDCIFGDFPSFLADHADCERKASAMAMSLVVRFGNHTALIEPMICLAKEELHHFHEVYRLMAARGIEIKKNESDTYIKELSKLVRHDEGMYLLDRLIVGAAIEARGCERFGLVAARMQEQGHELSEFYRRLSKEEAGHHRIFLKIACRYFDDHQVYKRLEQVMTCESSIVENLPLRPVVH
jgi:tRNA 2-(methylsulfanyl)-N6-isopentenyladenosine37 hydroxylase